MCARVCARERASPKPADPFPQLQNACCSRSILPSPATGFSERAHGFVALLMEDMDILKGMLQHAMRVISDPGSLIIQVRA